MDEKTSLLAEKYKSELLAYSIKHNSKVLEVINSKENKELSENLPLILFSKNEINVNNDYDTYVEMGYMIVKISFAGSSNPVIGAKISIKKGEVDLDQLSDSTGKTTKMTLPCPNSDGKLSCGTYDVEVEVNKYCKQTYYNVPVFADKVTILPVELYSVVITD